MTKVFSPSCQLKPVLFRVRPHAMGYLYSRSLKWRTSLTMNDLYDCTFANISVSTGDYVGRSELQFSSILIHIFLTFLVEKNRQVR